MYSISEFIATAIRVGRRANSAFRTGRHWGGRRRLKDKYDVAFGTHRYMGSGTRLEA